MADLPDSPHRYVNRDKLERFLAEDLDYDDDEIDGVLDWVDRQPEQPRLVGVTKIAEMCGVPASRVSGRYTEEGRLPPHWEVEGGNRVWPIERIQQFAREDKKSRRAWAKKRQKSAESAEATQA